MRFPFIVMNSIYGKCWNKINRYLKIRNAIALYQNLLESLIVINKWDIKNGTTKAVKIITKLLEIRFINTGGLDQWEIKRLSNVILEIIISYEDPKITRDFLTLLSRSPCRIGFYTELNVNAFFKTNLFIIGLNNYYEEPMTTKHFIEFVTQNLGINYTYNFDDDFNTELAIRIQEAAGSKVPQLNNNCISYSVAKDFNLFIESLPLLCEHLEINEQTIDIIDDVLYDYHRCLAANIQRIIVKHRDIFKIHPDDYEFGTSEFDKFTKAKHEHRYLSTMNQIMVEKIVDKIKSAGFTVEAQKIANKYVPMLSEVKKIPMPSSIPSIPVTNNSYYKSKSY
jgi:hypothetical protein